MTLIESASLRRVAILVFPGVELLDFAGPGEVFAAANTFRVALVAETVEPLRSQGFVTITPEYSIATCPVPDILVIPGGNVSHVMESAALLDWIRKVSASARYTMSVCNGALVLAEAGLLDGKRATTHHGSLPALRRRLGDSDVLDDKRWVDTGRIGTAAGVSAGIDLSLHVVSRVLDPATAARVARYMEYTWDPNAGESAR